MLHAELCGDFGIHSVEAMLRKHWSDSDIRKRDAEKGRYMSNWVGMDEDEDNLSYLADWDPVGLEAVSLSMRSK